METINKKVSLDLVGVDSNAFYIMGSFSKAARRQGWTKEEIAMVINEAQKSDYDHLLFTIQSHCE